jgi:hypothetical protein
MMAIVPIVILSLLVMLFLGRVLLQSLRRARRVRTTTLEEYVRARTVAIAELSMEMVTIERIFATEDLDFVVRGSLGALRHIFRDERRTLALFWVRNTQKRLAHLMELHLRLVSYGRQLDLETEIRTASLYLFFLFVSNCTLFIVWVRGPFAAASTIAFAVQLVGRLCVSLAPGANDLAEQDLTC